MERRKYFEKGGLLTGTGGFVATIPALVSVPGPAVIATGLTYSGICLGAIGVVLVLFPLIPKWHEDFPVVKRVGRGDLKRAHSFCGGLFGDNFSSFNSTKKWFNHNRNMFWLIEIVRHKGPAKITTIKGFFSILPLTENGIKMLLDNQIDGTKFTTDHIESSFDSPAAYYIGAVGSRGGKSKGVALGALLERMSVFQDKHPAMIYTRPTTRDGLRIARQHQFEAVDGSGTRDMNKLYVREAGAL